MRWLLFAVSVAVTLTALSLPNPAQAKVAVIETKAGQTFEGELITEDDRTVILLISGIETPIKRDTIKSMVLKKSDLEIYNERRAKLKDDDLDGRFKLAYDMYDMDALQIAKRETQDLLQAFPDSGKVERLYKVILDAIDLEDAQADPPANNDRPKPDQPKDNGQPPVVQGKVQNPFANLNPVELRELQLTDGDINQIRIWELPSTLKELEDIKPRVTISRDVIDEFFERYGEEEGMPRTRNEQNAFRRLDGYKQLAKFFEMEARDLYGEVRITSDPPNLLALRQTIYPGYIERYFARYFGQGQVDGLLLFAGRGDRVRVAYTDFYILHKFEVDRLPMIDRTRPEESLLLQWGLPRTDARYKAPDVPGWKPFFNSRDDPRFQQYVEWIESLYSTVEYDINYNAPKPGDGG